MPHLVHEKYPVKEKHQSILLLAPTLLVIAVFTIYPLMDGIRMAFTDQHLLRETYQFIGLENFTRIIKDDIFWLSLRHSLILTSVVVMLQLVLGLILAWAMMQPLPGMGIFKSIIMASWVIPVAATVIMFRFMAQPDIGLINIIFKGIGLDHLNKYWFGEPDFALAAIVMMHLWRNVPFYGVAFLAAMQSVPRSYYEAAEIDGANTWQQFVNITLPMIRPMIIVMVTIHVLWTFNNFDFIFLATGGGPVNATDVLPVYVYRLAWRSYTIGYSASIGVIMLIFLMIYFIAYIRLTEERTKRRWVVKNATRSLPQ
ncbi:MAG: sugar ABC transporter permease [Anaerolineales bacterium]|nr:sugar ABC transporter permease [Anaerolineales bacterium]